MSHPEIDQLVDLVRGLAGDDVRLHVDGCDTCGAQMPAIARVATAGAALGAPTVVGELVAPPGSVWDEIESELGRPRPVALSAVGAGRRPWRMPLVAAAAAVIGVLVGAFGAQLVGDSPDAPRAPSAAPSATAPAPVDVAIGAISPLGTSVTSGTVAMQRDRSALSLTVTFVEPVSGPGYVEVWLLDPATGEMLGLGVLGPSGGTVAVPAGTDLDRFTDVDISREPFDGDPAHSDESLARGTMRPA